MEDFVCNIPSEIKLHIEDCQATELTKAAELADKYALTHNLSLKVPQKGKGSLSTAEGNQKSSDSKKGKGNSSKPKGTSQLECYFCNKKGHKLKDCFKLKSYKEAEKKKPVGAIYERRTKSIRSTFLRQSWLQTKVQRGDP